MKRPESASTLFLRLDNALLPSEYVPLVKGTSDEQKDVFNTCQINKIESHKSLLTNSKSIKLRKIK